MNIRLSANPSRAKRIQYERQLKLLKFFDVIDLFITFLPDTMLSPEFFMKGDIENFGGSCGLHYYKLKLDS